MQLNWATSNEYGLRLNDFNEWLRRFAAAALNILSKPLTKQAWGESQAEKSSTLNKTAKSGNSKPSGRINAHQSVVAVKTSAKPAYKDSDKPEKRCKACDEQWHVLSVCKIFRDSTLEKRWEIARASHSAWAKPGVFEFRALGLGLAKSPGFWAFGLFWAFIENYKKGYFFILEPFFIKKTHGYNKIWSYAMSINHDFGFVATS